MKERAGGGWGAEGGREGGRGTEKYELDIYIYILCVYNIVQSECVACMRAGTGGKRTEIIERKAKRKKKR